MTGSGLAAYLTLSLLTGILPHPPLLPHHRLRVASHAAWTTQQQALATRNAEKLDKAVVLFEHEALLYWLLAHQPQEASHRRTLVLDTAAALTDAASALRSLGKDQQAAILYREASPLWASTHHPQTSAFSSLSGQELGTRFGVYTLKAGATALPGGKFVPPPGRLYLGAYTELDSRVGGNHFRQFDSLMHQRFGAFLEYLPWGDVFPTRFVQDCIDARAVPQIAWEPSRGLSAVRATPYVVDLLKRAGATGIPIFLRFGGEMNGPWVAWHGHPRAFVAAWRRLAVLVRRYAPNVALVWSPDVASQVGALDYYPGNAYVDWIGVSDYLPYASVHHGRTVTAAGATLLGQLRWIYRAFARDKPIMIAEGGVARASTLVAGSLDRYALDQYRALLANIPLFYPDVRALFFFDVNTLRHPNHNFSAALATSDFSLTDRASFRRSFRALLTAYRDRFAFPVSGTDPAALPTASLTPMAVTSGAMIRAVNGQITLTAQVHTYGRKRVAVSYRVGSRTVILTLPPYETTFTIAPAARPVAAAATLTVNGHRAARILFRVDLARSPAAG